MEVSEILKEGRCFRFEFGLGVLKNEGILKGLRKQFKGFRGNNFYYKIIKRNEDGSIDVEPFQMGVVSVEDRNYVSKTDRSCLAFKTEKSFGVDPKNDLKSNSRIKKE